MPKVVPLDQAPVDGDLPAPRPADAADVLAEAARAARDGTPCVLATVLDRRGSAPATPGQKLLVETGGACLGTVGGGAVEREVLAQAARMLAEGADRAIVRTFELGAELGMCCGGAATVVLEPLAARHPLLIVGGGHVATATAPLLAKVGFAVTVVDARERWATQADDGVRRVHGEYDDLDVPRHAAVLVMTHDHALDQRAIEWALRRGFAFVGGIGSRAKAMRTRDRLTHRGFSQADVDRVKMPIGVPCGARLPDEIAVSIAAELVGWRRSAR